MMTPEQYKAEKEYRLARSVLIRILFEKLITESEFAQIDTNLKAKYKPIIGDLLS
jgi:hypothetical protein